MSPPKLLFENLIAEIRSLPRPVWILVIGQFLNRFGAFVYPFLALYLNDIGFTLAQVAWVLGAISLGNFFGPIAGGYLADAIGRRNTIAVSLFGSGSLLIVLYHANSYGMVLLVGALFGFANFIFGPPTNALLTDLVPEKQRVTAFLFFRLAINAGFAAGPAVAGLLYTHSAKYIFYGDAISTFAFGLLTLLFLPHGLRTIRGNVSSPRVALQSWIEAVRDMLGNVKYCQFVLAVLLMGISFFQVFYILSLHATEKGLTPAAYGMVMGFNGLLIVILEIPLVQYLRELASRKVLAFGYALIGIGCALFAVASSLTGFIVAMAIFTIGEIVALPIGMAYSSALAPEEYRGRYFGIRGMSWALAGVIASVGAWLYGELGPMSWAILGVFSLAAAVVIVRRR